MARRLGVSRDDVVAAAVSVADRDGLGELTVAAVASEVGCRPPSVYHHVDGLDGLLRAVALVAAEDLSATLEAAVQDRTGRDAVAALTEAAHGWGVAHPARFEAVRRPIDAAEHPDLAAACNATLLPFQDALLDAGVPAEQRPTVLAALLTAIRGGVLADIDASDHDVLEPTARRAGRELVIGLVLDHLATLGVEADDPSHATT